ncbi:urease accessory protein UreD [Nocardia sp. FBN12]|uniref:urease accessory protein UreD n=1 Tax=Nocardia sp. FBN12 TaxID=3419766 RepID=UPI003CFF4677
MQPRGSGVAAVALDAGDYLVPRLLDTHGRHARVALVGRCGMLVAGDRLELDITVGPGVHLDLVEPSGTVAYNARGGQASWSARATVAEGATLSWLAAPLVIATGADLTREVDITLAEGGCAVLSELLVLGRSGETGGALRSRQHVTHAGMPLLVEELDLTDPAARDLPGMLGGLRVVGTVAVLGRRPAVLPGPRATSLAGPGALARVLGATAHTIEDEMNSLWQAWRV